MPLKKILPVILLTTIFLQLSALAAPIQEILIDDFGNGISPGWKEKSFAGKTEYIPTIADGRSCLMATSQGTASGLFYEIDIDPVKTPLLVWQWKVASIIPKGDARTKAGDDYAARIYVVFPSFFFWKTRALNYVWANKLPKGEAVPNAFTANAMMVAVESGPEKIGTWLEERRNIYDDYKKYFGEEPPKAGAIAIMTDTDNTGGKAMAWYGPIRLISTAGLGKRSGAATSD